MLLITTASPRHSNRGPCRNFFAIFTLISILLLGTPVFSGDWPQFRGPNRDGVSSETGLLQQWPEEVLPAMDLNDSVYAVMLTHDPKIDDQALHLLLRSEVAYIGALGSRKTHAKRVQRLSEAGFTPKEIERIHAPVGLAIGGISPAEIALSIMAEMVKVKHEIRSLSHT